MRRVGSLLAALFPAADSPASEVGSTTLAELSRRAEVIVVAREIGSPAPGTLRLRVEEAIRGAVGYADVRFHPNVGDEFDPSAARAWLLYLGRRDASSDRYAVLGGERGALPLEGPEDLAVLEAARSLAPAADLADERLREILLAHLLSASPRLREDAGEELARLQRPLLSAIPPAALGSALEREEGATPARAAILRAIEARADPRDLPLLIREVERGPSEFFPLLAGPFRSVAEGDDALGRSIEGLRGPRRAGACRLLGAVGGPRCASRLREALADPDPDVRLAAIEGLGRVPGSGEALLHLLASGTAGESRAALRSLLLVGTEEERASLRAIAPSIPAARAELDALASDPFRFFRQSKKR